MLKVVSADIWRFVGKKCVEWISFESHSNAVVHLTASINLATSKRFSNATILSNKTISLDAID
jgi:hypothetical protein